VPGGRKPVNVRLSAGLTHAPKQTKQAAPRMSRRKKSAQPAPPASSGGWQRHIIPIALGLTLLMVAGALVWRFWDAGKSSRDTRAKSPSPQAAQFQLEPQKKVFAEYAGSESCRECHAEAFGK